MYELGTVRHFEAAHRLVGDFGPATRMHGHTYRLEVTLRGERLDQSGALMDVGRLAPILDALVARLHMRDLSEVPELSNLNTTAETVARFCWDVLAPDLHAQGFSSMAVRLWESPNIFAGYEAPLS